MRKILGIWICCAVAVSAMAAPARRIGQVRTMEDGTEKTVYQHGDEFFHYLTDEDGTWLDEKTLLPLTAERRAKKEELRAESEVRRVQATTGLDTLLAPRGAIILVSYPDLAFTSTQAEMRDWAMGENYTYNGATGSVHQYFFDQSWGQYDLQLDVYGPVTVSKEMAYYGQDGSKTGADQHADELVVEACQLAAAQGADFSPYDYNNDGKVDWVVVLFAGLGQNDGGAANTIWPHQSDLSRTGKAIQLNGKTVDHYCILNEIDGVTKVRSGIGTFCHEFSHIMGLPDMYTTDGSLHKTLGMWDLMDYGIYNNDVNTPPNYSVYERWFMGWMEPQLLSSAAKVTLPVSNSKAGCYITDSGEPVDNILRAYPPYYILENRQQTGWDTYLPGHGLIITRLEFKYNNWNSNTVNNSASKMGVDLIEADGLAPSRDDTNRKNGFFGKPGDAYPEGATSFTQVSGFQVTDITEQEGVIRFLLNGGGGDLPLAIEATNEDEAGVQKRMENGQIIILREGKKYTLTGLEMFDF